MNEVPGSEKAIRPNRVVALSVFGFLKAFLYLVGSIMSVYYYFYIFKDTFSNPTGLLAFLLLPFFIFITFLFLALGVFQALIAYKLLQGRNWARITQIVILIIDFLLSVLNLASFYFEKELELQQSIQVVPIIIPLIILWFLIFDKTTKEYFKKNTN